MSEFNQEAVVELLQKQGQLIEALAQKELKTKAPANFGTFTPLHGPGGIFTSAGLERDIISAHVRPYGIASQLPLIPTVNTDPRFGAITGFTDVTGNEPTTSCADAPAGYMKAATLTARLGLLRRDSQTIDMTDTMLKLHRGDFTDLMLRGQVLGLTNLNPSDTNQNDILNIVSAAEMVTVGVNLERVLSRQLWQSTVAAGYMGPGLDAQIATGQVDADTNVAVPSLDSDVKDFALDDVAGSGRDIVEYLSMLEFYLRNNAMTMGLEPVTWVIAMRPELWQELTAVWPCKYNTHRCGDADLGSNSRVFVDGRENVAERDAMRNGRYIDINGNRYNVILDTGIFEHNNVNNGSLNPGEYASSIYMLPLNAGGMPVLYREYLDYRQAARDVAFTGGRLDAWWTDNGVYSWALTQEKWCYKFHARTEQRVVLRTPHLAGRIDLVKYTPLQHLRESYPDSPYFKDGGVSLRGTPQSYNAVWG
jgi:hypothetical protein